MRRYCHACGSPMGRVLARRDGWSYDARTGKAPRLEWWWACSMTHYDDNHPYTVHARSLRIRESKARARLRALAPGQPA